MAPDEQMAHASSQAFLDSVSELPLSDKERNWYYVDVKTVLGETPIINHEVNHDNGDALVFLKSSLMYCNPSEGRFQHFPRNLVDCFVDDFRMRKKEHSINLIFRGELFSVTPHDEQLCWKLECKKEGEVPPAQRAVAEWMSWLNRE